MMDSLRSPTHTSQLPESFISSATTRNWRKLGVKNPQTKLTTRANKKRSTKRIFPMEYICQKRNIESIQSLVQYIIDKRYSTANAIYSLALNLLQKHSLLHKTHTKNVLQDYCYMCHKDLLTFALPNNEKDLLGLIYQCLLFEGEKNAMGSYYTPHNIATQMTKGLDFSNGQIFLDPSCGSGAFMLALRDISPHQICGIDSDYLAVFIAKVNLLLRFSDCVFSPQIYCANYLDCPVDITHIQNPRHKLAGYVDYIITNPPWGAYREACAHIARQNFGITSKERGSLFFAKAYSQLAPNGLMRFLLPRSVLNVKTHKDLRSFILDNGALQSITHYANIFSGVTTEFVSIEHTKSPPNTECTIIHKERSIQTPLMSFRQTHNLTFNAYTKQDITILQKIKNIGRYSLDKSIWALGIVTGNNSALLYTEPHSKSEPIYTGKDIMPYRLQQAKKHIIYQRNALQQVAKDEYYRASEKLMYKFISSSLVFAYDDSKALCLNSANILIPHIPTMSIKSVLGLLNSCVFTYLYRIMFSEIKILQGNLLELPFPHITKDLDTKLSTLVTQAINGDDEAHTLLQAIIYDIFHLTLADIARIEEVVYGNAND